MHNWRQLRVMVTKEVRTTFRERSQIGGMLVGLLVMVFVLGSALHKANTHSHLPRANTSVNPYRSGPAGAELPEPALRWILIGAAAMIGFFFSTGYLLSAVVASFVGEKEGRTLEILLASPLSDGKLFAVKCVSVFLPSLTIGYGFTIAAAILSYTLTPPEWTDQLTGARLGAAVALSLPLLMAVQLWFVGIGSAVSVKAETMKGANQILGVVFMVLIFGLGYGVPFLLALDPPARAVFLQAWQKWSAMQFWLGYGLAMVIFFVPAVVAISIGRACFKRDRMLV